MGLHLRTFPQRNPNQSGTIRTGLFHWIRRIRSSTPPGKQVTGIYTAGEGIRAEGVYRVGSGQFTFGDVAMRGEGSE